MKKNRLLLVALLLVLVFVATSCGGGKVQSPPAPAETQTESTQPEQKEEAKPEVKEDAPQEPTQEAEPAETSKAGGTLKVGEFILDTQMANKNPFAPSGTWTGLNLYVYEPLLYFNPIDGKLLPALADEYTWNDDYSKLTIKVNTKAKWHDGEPFTAEDVANVFQMLKEYPVMDRYGLWSKLSAVSADGDSVVFDLQSGFLSLPFYLSEIQMVPKHIWEKQAPDAFLNETPIGTGPFVYKSYNTGTDIQFEANKDYWRGAPNVDNVIVMMYNSSPNVTLALLKGDIDMTMGTLAMASTPEFLSKPNAKMQVYAGLNNFSVLMNHENPLLADVNVRKAMAMAVNQGDLITKGEYNGVFPTSIGWLPDIFGDIANPDAKAVLEFSVDGAKQVLEDAGYSLGNDGIYQKDGKRLSFTYHNASGAPAQQMEAGMIQQWLLNIGIEIIPKLATWPELTKLAQSGNYNLLQMGIAFPPDPYAALNTSFSSSMTAPTGEVTPGTNYFRYKNPEVDKLLEQVSSETDPAKQKSLYHELQMLIANDFVFLPMYNVGGHIPYYTTNFEGWNEEYPVTSVFNTACIYMK